jgi:hypothetical protein
MPSKLAEIVMFWIFIWEMPGSSHGQDIVLIEVFCGFVPSKQMPGYLSHDILSNSLLFNHLTVHNLSY